MFTKTYVFIMHFGLIVLHTLYKVCQFYLSIFSHLSIYFSMYLNIIHIKKYLCNTFYKNIILLVGSNGIGKPRPKNSSLNYFCLTISSARPFRFLLGNHHHLVGSNGIEPSTSRLSGVRSNHLSYEPIYQSCSLSMFSSVY